jgi:hypothetical protein
MSPQLVLSASGGVYMEDDESELKLQLSGPRLVRNSGAFALANRVLCRRLLTIGWWGQYQ